MAPVAPVRRRGLVSTGVVDLYSYTRLKVQFVVQMIPFCVSRDATLPTRGTTQAAGLDLYASADAIVPPRGQKEVSTGVSVQIPNGFFGSIRSRSGLAFKSGIFAFDGTIDADYRGEIRVLLLNHSDNIYEIKSGERIAQLVIMPFLAMKPFAVEQLALSERGCEGFGSTGK